MRSIDGDIDESDIKNERGGVSKLDDCKIMRNIEELTSSQTIVYVLCNERKQR